MPPDRDGDGFSLPQGDCDDGNPSVNPDANEICNTIDDDCDGSIDESDAIDATTWYQDVDQDGYGNAAATVTRCAQPDGYVASGSGEFDCADTDPNRHPGQDETCDGVDNNCNGGVDEGVTQVFYPDNDGDGFGRSDPSQPPANGDEPVDACSAPEGYVEVGGDCDDTDASAFPGALETCDDTDNDCDGAIDEDLDFTDYYVDSDGDGFGAGPATSSCTALEGMTITAGDCDDTDAGAFPGALETCNLVDDDCDGEVDEGVMTEWYLDSDGDGAGDPDHSVVDCAPPSGYVASSDDCDDTNPDVYPDASDDCGVDNNCNGVIDEGYDVGEIACPAINCLEIRDSVPGAEDGYYHVDPEQDGQAFQVHCLFSVSGGGWTHLSPEYQPTLQSVSREYLYYLNGNWYRSPVTHLVWNWAAYQPLEGTYYYNAGSDERSFGCVDRESGHFGVGCSNGGGDQWKVLPIYNKDPANGRCTICQDQPDVFGAGACAGNVEIYSRP